MITFGSFSMFRSSSRIKKQYIITINFLKLINLNKNQLYRNAKTLCPSKPKNMNKTNLECFKVNVEFQCKKSIFLWHASKNDLDLPLYNIIQLQKMC